MRFRSDKDLFAESTMTFGEHLEELRTCLFKAIIGLAAGVIVGLYVGGDVVDYIQQPLSNALRDYYEKASIRRAREEVTTHPEALKAGTPDEVEKLIREDNILPEEYYLNPNDLLAELKRVYPGRFKDLPTAKPASTSQKPPERKDLVRLFLWRPMEDDPRVKVKSLSAHEPFSIYMKASFLVGIVLASPWVFYQLWSFVAAGLYAHERRYVYIFFPFSLGLFLAGAALAFFVVFKPVLSFLFSFNSWMGIEPDPRISEWLGFVLIMPLGFGVGFQLPLVMLFLERIGLVTAQFYLSQWRLAVLTIAIVAMILTPPDPYSMTLMLVPLTLLYFGGIALCRLLPRFKSPYADEPADDVE
jgi:sec-independent protein translocase protein TatC